MRSAGRNKTRDARAAAEFLLAYYSLQYQARLVWRYE